MSEADRCRHPKESNGAPCPTSIGLCSNCGYCLTHCDYGPECDYDEEEVRAARAQGGKAKARKQKSDGLHTDELPPLRSPQAAEDWCDAVGRAVVTGRVGHNEANAALRAVREWRESHEAGEVSERLEKLMDALAEWRKTGDPEPVMELVE